MKIQGSKVDLGRTSQVRAINTLGALEIGNTATYINGEKKKKTKSNWDHYTELTDRVFSRIMYDV